MDHLLTAFILLSCLTIIRVLLSFKYNVIPKEHYQSFNNKFFLVFVCIIAPTKEEIQLTFTLICFKHYCGSYYWILNCFFFSIMHIGPCFNTLVNSTQLISVFLLRMVLDEMDHLGQQILCHMIYNVMVSIITIRCAKIQNCFQKKKSFENIKLLRKRSRSFDDHEQKKVYYGDGDDLKIKTKGDEIIKKIIDINVENKFQIKKYKILWD